MFCVTGGETNLTDLNARLLRNRDLPMQEIRLDLLEGPSFPIPEEIRGATLVATCRRSGEGGSFPGSEDERICRLEEFARSVRPGWIDIETSTPMPGLGRILEVARDLGSRVLFSHHELEPGRLGNLKEVTRSMTARKGDGIKIAYMVDDAADLLDLWKATRDLPEPKVVIGMGPAGLLSRVLYKRFGSGWTYVAEHGKTATARGQLTLEGAVDMGMPVSNGAALYTLLGGPQIMSSPGPKVYNRLFQKRGIDACYLPVITAEPERTIPFLLELGLRGSSVTMPLKEKVVPLLSTLSDESRRANAVNTITAKENGELVGDLTDGEGAFQSIKRNLAEVAGKTALILGTGSTARAIGVSLKSHGMEVVLLGRDILRTRRAAEQISVGCGKLVDLEAFEFDILVNATPVGSLGLDVSLVKDPMGLKGKVVLDVVHGKETKLLRDAGLHGGFSIGGRAMWAEQGRLQLKRWFGLDIEASELEGDS